MTKLKRGHLAASSVFSLWSGNPNIADPAGFQMIFFFFFFFFFYSNELLLSAGYMVKPIFDSPHYLGYKMSNSINILKMTFEMKLYLHCKKQLLNLLKKHSSTNCLDKIQ